VYGLKTTPAAGACGSVHRPTVIDWHVLVLGSADTISTSACD